MTKWCYHVLDDEDVDNGLDTEDDKLPSMKKSQDKPPLGRCSKHDFDTIFENFIYMTKTLSKPKVFNITAV